MTESSPWKTACIPTLQVKLSRYLPAVLGLLLPGILVYSSLRTFRELDQMKAVFLRNRAASIAGRLETLAAPFGPHLPALLDSESGLLDITVFSKPTDGPLTDLWNGRQLFRTETLQLDSTAVFRASIPFHNDGQLNIAQIDLDARSADFLLLHARHNVLIASVSSAVIILLAAYALWSMQRTARDEKRNLELRHLAHLGKMSAVLAHEIRTPLATIKGFTQLAIEQSGDGVRSILEPLVEETQRLERLVSDLLLYGRPPAPVIRYCSWSDIAMPLKAADPCVTVASFPVRFRSDVTILRHVLVNLVRNAVEALAGASAPWVGVSAQIEGDQIVIAVDDNGPGIAAQDKERVFESFYTTKSFGTGLGLPIARSLTASLGGSLSLRDREGGGLHVEVRIPAAGIEQFTAEVNV